MSDGQPDDLDRQWWRYRNLRDGAIAGLAAIGVAIAWFVGNALSLGIALVVMLLFATLTGWRYWRGARAGDARTRTVQLSDEEVERVAAAIVERMEDDDA